MSIQYDDYLVQHTANVRKGFDWIKENLPDLVKGDTDYGRQIRMEHDLSKSDPGEYGAYDAYFYGKNRSCRRFRLQICLASPYSLESASLAALGFDS